MTFNKARQILENDSLFLVSSNAAQLLIRLLSTVVLTRILDPNSYGILAIITTIQIVVLLTSDLGLYPYVVRSKLYQDEKFLNDVWSIRLIRGFLNSLLIFFLAPLVSLYTGSTEIEKAIQAVSLLPLLEALTSMAFATAAREGKIKLLTISEFIPSVFGILVSILICYLMDSYWGIIISGYISIIIKIYFSYRLFPNSKRNFSVSVKALRDMWKFSKYILPSSLISLIIGQFDKVLFARIFTLNELGLYNVASNLGLAPVSLVSSYSSRILYPVFVDSFNKTPDQKSEIFYGTDRKIRAAILFLFGLFCFSSTLIVDVLYDDRYIGAAKYLFALSIYSVLSYVVSISIESLIAIGYEKSTFYSNLVRVFSLIFFLTIFFFSLPLKFVVYALPASVFATYIFNLFRLQKLGIFRIKGEISYWLYFFAGGVGGTVFSQLVAFQGFSQL
jgi:O-antigen/teichoic acid export membrane protein